MKTIDEKTTKALRKLIVINNDRTIGYQDAKKHAEDEDLKLLFEKYSLQSKKFANEIEMMIPDLSDDVPGGDETKNSGKLFRTWMEIKDNLAPNNRKAVLSSCEFGEDHAKKEYDGVLEDSEDVSSEALELVRRQRSELQVAHDNIKSMRDSA
ncbi:MAG: PA2169 family four-helix-bundle protein [Bacteroidia bacterium]